MLIVLLSRYLIKFSFKTWENIKIKKYVTVIYNPESV